MLKLEHKKNSIRIKPGYIIALGFAIVILIGAIILFLPFSQNHNVDVSFVDALFTSTSAVCVTGLIAVDSKDTFSVFGRVVLALLIQIGGLGVTSIGVGLMVFSGRKINLRQRNLVKEALNYGSFTGILALVKAVLFMTLLFEGVGALLSFLVFSKDYPVGEAIGISVFHSIAAFNNSGFDILGGMRNLIPYQNDILLNLTTCGLIIFGGLGFFAIREIVTIHNFKKFSLHTKIVITMTVFLLISGTIIIKCLENISWLGAFLTSTSARTAGFSTFPISEFSSAGLLIVMILMFIGASPGSTGGGIKTTTCFTLVRAAISITGNRRCTAFRRTIPKDIIAKAFVIMILGLNVVILSTLLLCIGESNTDFLKILFEVVSAFGTVGLSTGITPDLTDFSKLILVVTMFIGRLGPLTIASLIILGKQSQASYAEEMITIG